MPTPSTASPPGVPEADGRATESNSDVGRLVKHSSIYAIGSVLNRVGAFILLPVYTNYLSLAQYGELEMFYAVAAVAGGLLSVGLAHATLRFYFEYEDPQDRREVVSTNLIVATGIAAIGALAVAPFREAISSLVFGAPGHELGIAIVLTTMVFEMSTQIGLAYLRARESSVFFLSVVLLRLVAQVGVNTWLVVGLGAGVTGVLAGNCFAVALGWTLVTVYTVRHCGLACRLDKAVPVLRYSYPFLLSTVVGIVAANADRVFIRSILSFEALGLFALATKFSRLLEELIGLPFSQAYGSFRFSIMHQGNAADIQARVARVLFALAVTMGLGVVLFAGDVLTVVSDESFHAAREILPLLVAAAIARVMTYPMQTGILVRKQTREIFYLGLLEAVLYVGASYFLIQGIGLMGASLALLIVAVVVLWATDRLAQRHFAVEYGLRRWGQILILAAYCYAATLPLLHAPLWIGVPLKLAVLLLFVAALARSSVFDDTERELAMIWLQRTRCRWLGRARGLAAASEGGA